MNGFLIEPVVDRRDIRGETSGPVTAGSRGVEQGVPTLTRLGRRLRSGGLAWLLGVCCLGDVAGGQTALNRVLGRGREHVSNRSVCQI